MPALILQLNGIVQASVDKGVSEGVLRVEGLRPQASWDRIGRYAKFSGESAGFWLGVEFGLWKTHGESPVWLIFHEGSFGRAFEVQPFLEPWLARKGVFSQFHNDQFVVAVRIATGEDRDMVIRNIVDCLKEIGEALSELNPKPIGLDSAELD